MKLTNASCQDYTYRKMQIMAYNRDSAYRVKATMSDMTPDWLEAEWVGHAETPAPPKTSMCKPSTAVHDLELTTTGSARLKSASRGKRALSLQAEALENVTLSRDCRDPVSAFLDRR